MDDSVEDFFCYAVSNLPKAPDYEYIFHHYSVAYTISYNKNPLYIDVNCFTIIYEDSGWSKISKEIDKCTIFDITCTLGETYQKHKCVGFVINNCIYEIIFRVGENNEISFDEIIPMATTLLESRYLM